jgi:hypothetical protein
VLVRGYDGGQADIVAIIKDLEELFLRPGSTAFRAQIVKDKKGSVADLLKLFIKADEAVGSEGGAQMVEQIGNGHKQDWQAMLYQVVGNSRREVGLARTITTQ